MIPILLLDLAGIILVVGYVLIDRHQNSSQNLPTVEPIDHHRPPATSSSLPVEPIVAQHPLPANLEPRRIRRPPRRAGKPVQQSIGDASRSDEV